MLSCSRKLHFCYGHRLMGHENKCASLHGHNASVWIEAVSLTDTAGKDAIGRVIDFSVIKERVGEWIELHWDHTTILSREDKQTIELLKQVPGKKDIFILPDNPTAENLTHYLMWEVCPKVLHKLGIIVHRIEFYETENCKVYLSVAPNDPEMMRRYGY